MPELVIRWRFAVGKYCQDLQGADGVMEKTELESCTLDQTLRGVRH